MNEIPMTWIDRIFEHMETYFKDKWARHIFGDDRYMKVLKIQWKSALFGLKADEIKKGLNECRKIAENGGEPNFFPIDFYMYCKGTEKPYLSKIKPYVKLASIDVSKENLNKIKNMLNPTYFTNH